MKKQFKHPEIKNVCTFYDDKMWKKNHKIIAVEMKDHDVCHSREDINWTCPNEFRFLRVIFYFLFLDLSKRVVLKITTFRLIQFEKTDGLTGNRTTCHVTTPRKFGLYIMICSHQLGDNNIARTRHNIMYTENNFDPNNC